MSKEDVADVLWPPVEGDCAWPDRWVDILKSVLSQLRTKTKEFGFDIRAIRHRGNPGYYLHWKMAEKVA